MNRITNLATLLLVLCCIGVTSCGEKDDNNDAPPIVSEGTITFGEGDDLETFGIDVDNLNLVVSPDKKTLFIQPENAEGEKGKVKIEVSGIESINKLDLTSGSIDRDIDFLLRLYTDPTNTDKNICVDVERGRAQINVFHSEGGHGELIESGMLTFLINEASKTVTINLEAKSTSGRYVKIKYFGLYKEQEWG